MLTIDAMSRAAVPLILAIVLLRALGMHKLPKRTLPLLWSIVLLRLLVPVRLPSIINVGGLVEKLWTTPVRTPLAAPTASNVPVPVSAVQITPEVPSSSPAINWLPWIWMLGTLMLATYFLITYLRCHRRFEASLPVAHEGIASWQAGLMLRRRIRVRQSDRVQGPLTYGILRPVILLPKAALQLPENTLLYILTHEVTHIRRFDALGKLALTAALCLHWFNPLVWIMYILANRDMELACDEKVILSFGETGRSSYALTLIHMEERRSQTMPLHSNFSKYAIEERIHAIMTMKKTSLWSTLLALTLILTLAFVFTTTASATNTPEAAERSDSVTDAFEEANSDASDDEPISNWYTPEEYEEWLEVEKAVLQAHVDAGEEGWTQEAVDQIIGYYEQTLAQIRDGLLLPKSALVDGISFSFSDASARSAVPAQGSITLDEFTYVQDGVDLSVAPSFHISKSGGAQGSAVQYTVVPANEAIVTEQQHMAQIAIDDTTTVSFGPFENEEALDAAVRAYCEAQVSAGLMTQEKADEIMKGY